jgi:hypothetical protein
VKESQSAFHHRFDGALNIRRQRRQVLGAGLVHVSKARASVAPPALIGECSPDYPLAERTVEFCARNLLIAAVAAKLD